jgi:hypothetical protein
MGKYKELMDELEEKNYSKLDAIGEEAYRNERYIGKECARQI